MKNPIFIIILLAVALVAVSYMWIRSSSASPDNSAPTSGGRDAIDVIMTRSSIRSYSDRPVSAEQVDTLLRAAMAAPTAMNEQPWRFVVVRNREVLDTIASRFSTMKMAAEAQVAIITCGDINAVFNAKYPDYWIEDVSAATENLLLAAHAMGLGAVWCGIYPVEERVEQFSEMFSLPANIIPMACVNIGYPAAEATPKDKWKPENVIATID